MEYNDKDKCYYADIHVKDTYYTIDNDTNKLYNELKAIIDPDVDNAPTLLDSINDAMNSVSQLTNIVNSTIKDAVGEIEQIPRQLSNFKSNFIEDAQQMNLVICGTDGNPGRAITKDNYTLKTIQDALNELDALKNTPPTSEDEQGHVTPSVDPEDWKRQIEGLKSKLSTSKTKIENCNKNELQKAPETFKTKSKDVNKMLTGVTNIPGFLNCVTPINTGDTIDSMTKKAENLKGQSIVIYDESQQFASDLSAAATLMKNNFDQVAEVLNTSKGLWDEANPPDPDPEGGSEPLVNPFTAWIENIGSDSNMILTYIGVGSGSIRPDSMIYMCNQYASLCANPEKAINQIIPNIGNIKNKVTNIKSSALGAWNSIQNIGKTAQKSLEKITNLSKEISNKVKSLDFSIKSLPDLQKNINIVKDISKIGMLGISTFNVNLSISGGGKATGEKIIKVKNDNNNELKNIKSEIETYSNMISVSKSNLDIDTFTINKRYVIKNYDAHSNKNGVFILIKKSDFFIRSGNRFKVSTQLEFAKVADEIKKDGTVVAAVDSRQEVQNILKHADSILELSKGKISIMNASSIIKHAEDIQTSYSKLAKSGSTGKPLSGLDTDNLIIH